MGNLHTSPPLPTLGLLTHWQLPEVKALFRVYWSLTPTDNHLLPQQLFNYLMMKSPIAKSAELFRHFEVAGGNWARMLEFFTAVTVYAWATFTNKAKCTPHPVMFKLFDFNDDNVLCFDELKILVKTVIGALAIVQGIACSDFNSAEQVTEQLFKGNTQIVGDEMTFEEFVDALETADYKSGFITAPDDTAERLPLGLFQRFFIKLQSSPLRVSHPRFSSVNPSPIRMPPATLRLPPLHRIISEKAVSGTKRVFVVLFTIETTAIYAARYTKVQGTVR